MKTTIEIADPIYRQVKARAALKGISVRAFVSEAIQDKLRRDDSASEVEGWRAAFGKASEDEIKAIQERLDSEFSQIREEDWQ